MRHFRIVHLRSRYIADGYADVRPRPALIFFLARGPLRLRLSGLQTYVDMHTGPGAPIPQVARRCFGCDALPFCHRLRAKL